MKMINLLKGTLMVMALALVSLLGGCEDAPPNDYVPQYVVQGYLLVDEPIDGIILSRSQSVTDTFNLAAGAVTDADVRIVADGHTLPLQYRGAEGSVGEYYYPDTNERVKPGTLYKLEVTTKDGSTVTAETRTPGRFAWTRPPADTVSIPPTSSPAYLNPPDSLDLVWTGTAGVPEYLISVRALDTAEYGRYLAPPTNQRNRRVNPDLDELDELHYNDRTRWGFVGSTITPIVWAAFKWFGPQEVSVYAADRNFINWFKMTQWSGNPQYDPLLGNIRGGVGIFASASVIRKDVFVLMPVQ